MKTLLNYIKESSGMPQSGFSDIYESSEMLPKPNSFEDMLKACKKNALFKSIEKKCKSYGYTLIDAHFDYYGPNATIPSFRLVQPQGEKWAPEIVLNVDVKSNYKFQVVGSSSSHMDLEDAEKWAFCAQKAVDLLKWLSKQDLSKLPVFSYAK